ncbi:GH25 family lysozyme M1 (1,4-beta-N-acetylmuramidase) [Nonomuraea polychroma]|uniref:GH25 family lysozyme M1 (1,4-beta-N-acetylmuramidase) n=1 Tax=Nonomuraea polychroma TaxID=46176 RepID=A0A438M2Z3_9ACTN|nr:GH25 family lysozyme [Nonomuraea polychroma]RVX39977.1 GH25 family lysozyme M1 (1,4-beta-N-acetylmuramidase) [Nonomuraea polychroma]
MADHRLNSTPKINFARVASHMVAPGMPRRLAATALLAMTTAVAATSVADPAHANDLPYGQDVSNYQATHDWAASGAKFGIVKATEGSDFTDRAFVRHWTEMAKRNIVRGAYHYGHPANDPIVEADFFLSVVNKQPAKPGDLLALDLETTDGQSVADVNAWAKKWLERVKAKTGITPLFYSSWNFANTYGQGLGQYPLWVAHYGKAKGTVTPPAPWKRWTIHQYTDSPVDQNVSAVHSDQLRALGRK